MLKKVKQLDFDAHYSYAPPAVDAVVNLDFIASVTPVETRYREPCVRVHLKDGRTLVCVGTANDFLEPQPATPPAADPYFGEPLKEDV